MKIRVEPVPEEIDHIWAEILVDRETLAATVVAAQQKITAAQAVLRRLIDLYDVEYAEDGGQFASFLADAEKALYAAQLMVERNNG